MATRRTSGGRMLVNIAVVCVLLVGVILVAKFAGTLFIPLLAPQVSSNADGDPRGLSGLYVAADRKAGAGQIELRPDHTATVRGLAGLDGLGRRMNCTWNGEAQWWNMRNVLALKMTQTRMNHSTCRGHWVNYGFDVVGPRAPYQLSMYMGYFAGQRGAIFERSTP